MRKMSDELLKALQTSAVQVRHISADGVEHTCINLAEGPIVDVTALWIDGHVVPLESFRPPYKPIPSIFKPKRKRNKTNER